MNRNFIINKGNLEKQSVDLFLDIGNILTHSTHLQDTLTPILMILADRFYLDDALITIFDNKSKEIYIEASYGLVNNGHKKVRYQLGEGIIGEVVQTGEKKIVPQIKREPKFLNRAKQRNITREFSFICVPIKEHNIVTGTLSITLPYHEENDLLLLSNFMNILTFLLVQPVILQRKLSIVQKKIDNHSMDTDNRFSSDIFIGSSRNTKPLKNKIYMLSKENSPVFISGEHGTGKTYAVHIIHNNSIRKHTQLVQCNCAILPAKDYIQLLFGELSQNFGVIEKDHSYEPNPFILKAQNTTLLIEDIDLLPLQVQKMLLQIIQSDEIIVNNKQIKLSIRFIFTSEYSLAYLKEHEKIIDGLYEILEQNTISIPPLRERKDDIILIADRILQEFAETSFPQNNETPRRLSTPAIDLLSNYHWPGNVNELYKVIESAIYKSEGGVIHAHILPPSLQSAESSNTQTTIGLFESVERLEKDLIIDTLKSTFGHLSHTATLLKISDRILGLRIKKYHIDPKRYK